MTLLGQNVNSFRDTSEVQFRSAAAPGLSRGFSTIYKAKEGGLRFTHLLDQVSRVDPEMRIRFTSPHPKDFPDEVRVKGLPGSLPVEHTAAGFHLLAMGAAAPLKRSQAEIIPSG